MKTKTIKILFASFGSILVAFFVGLVLYRLNIFSNSGFVVGYKKTIDNLADTGLGLMDKFSGRSGKYQWMPGWISISEMDTNLGKYFYQMPITMTRVDPNGKGLFVRDFRQKEFYIKLTSWGKLSESSVVVFSWSGNTLWQPVEYAFQRGLPDKKYLGDLLCNMDLMTISWSSDLDLSYWADIWGYLRPDHVAELLYVNLNLYSRIPNPNLDINETCD